jgi:tetratricopeptide (TPR) repeat protein
MIPGWRRFLSARVTTRLALLLTLVGLSAAHAMEGGVPTSVAEWAHGARLFEGLGDFHRSVTTSSPEAQQYFDQGMRLLWAFNHDEATRSFARSAELDPGCAACFWGVALTVGPNYNLPGMEQARARVAAEALQKAREQAPHASAVEQGLIEALTTRYPTSEPLDPASLEPVTRAYANAMRELAQRFPQDLDVQTLSAEAAMNVHAWKLWSPDGQPTEGTPEIEARLESVLRRDPGHPGANHYYVHAMEASPHPEKALAAAERLPGMMPAAGHLEHMPAHIEQRVGHYEQAAEANRRGIVADRAYFAATSAPDYYAMYLAHNYAFLAFSAAMEGRKAETLAAVQSVLSVVPLEMVIAMGDSGWNLSQPYAALVRFGLWDEAIALGPPDARAPGLTAAYLYSRGVALAARGRLEDARAALAQLHQLAATTPNGAQAGFNTLHGVLAVAEPIVAARIAASEQRNDEALTLLRQAVAAQDELAYNEPADWFFPARHLLGAQLLIAGRAAEAERIYRDDLVRNPANGWALYGLAAALRAQGKSGDAAQVNRRFEAAWRHADVRLQSSAFWFAGPDTLSCECQRTALSRPADGS